MTKSVSADSHERRILGAKWLTPRRIRAQAIVLALCLWGAFAVDFASPGLFDRAGNIKFQDFLPFYISAHMVREHSPSALYNPQVATQALEEIIGRPSEVRLPYLYGPQVALFFSPLAGFSFPVAATIWATVSVLIFFLCVYLVWKHCPALNPYSGITALAALAFPPLFHFFVRAQISALVLACFTIAFLALDRDRELLAGVALGCLIFKPQFFVAIPLILLLARAGKALTALVLSATAQLLIARLYFGAALMRSYFDMLLHPGRWLTTTELTLAPIQMHSLRAFWGLLIPWATAAFVLYILSSIAAIAIAAYIWRSTSPLAIRFSALTVAAVLVNPHLFVYDLLVLAPVLLLLADTSLRETVHSAPALSVLVYLSFILPLFGPVSRWTHLQFSVLAFSALLWCLRSCSQQRPVVVPLRSSAN